MGGAPVPGLVLWLDASEGSTLVADAQGLSQWRDKSGKGNHVGQPEAGARPTLAPTLQNGMAPISFDGATQFLTGPAVLPEGQTAYTIVALWRPRRQGVQSVFEQAGTAVQSNGRAALLAVGDAYGFNGEHNDCHQLVPYESNLWRLTCMDVDSARAPTVRIFDNGIRRSGVTPAPAALRLGAGGITVGRKQAMPGEFLDGEVAAVLVFDRVLVYAEQQQVLGSLDRTWGVDVLGWFRGPDGGPLGFDFDGDTYGAGWTVEGTAFGTGPARGTLPGQMEVSGFLGEGLVNSYVGGDGSTGLLTSPALVIERRFIQFLIGGGKYPGEACINLLVGGAVVRTATGPNEQPGGSERLDWAQWDVAEFAGKTAVVQIVDRATGAWGHINVDQIIQTDRTLPVLVDQQRELLAERRYLNLPVKDGAPKRRFRVLAAGKVVRDAVVPLADATPDYWMFIDLEPFRGQLLTLQVERLPETSGALAAMEQSDEIKGAADLYRERLRPQVHFSTRRGWNNDPNGLVYHAGEWHLFYQHNPYSTRWDNMHWGHAVSPDLVHWQELPVALYPDALGPCFSGSAVVDTENTAGFQTGTEPALVCIYTAAGNPTVQCLAYSLDRGRTWATYASNPVLPQIIGGNRDPKVIWYAPGRCWIMALFLDQNDYGLFSSPDLKRWERLCTVTIPGSSECPEFFAIPVAGKPGETRWIFYGGNGLYLIGQFDGKSFTTESGPHELHQGTCFYASQTYNSAPDGRRVLIGWGTVSMPGMPFNQMMTFPVDLTLRPTADGLRLHVQPAPEISRLHDRAVELPETTIPVGETPLAGLEGDAFHIRAEFATGAATAFGLTVRGIPITYDVQSQRLDCGGRSASVPPGDGQVQLEIIADRTSLEIFVNAGRVYLPMGVTLPEVQRGVVLFSRGAPTRVSRLQAWSLTSIWP
jgi:fructan beta-fructosidase